MKVPLWTKQSEPSWNITAFYSSITHVFVVILKTLHLHPFFLFMTG